MKTYDQFLLALCNISYAAYPFKQLGISIGEEGIRFNWQSVPYIKNAVDDFTWRCGLPMQSAMALAIACTEETRNNYVDDSEIEAVNKFFKVNVTRQLISKFHSKFI